jgi:hypothetical protein
VVWIICLKIVGGYTSGGNSCCDGGGSWGLTHMVSVMVCCYFITLVMCFLEESNLALGGSAL